MDNSVYTIFLCSIFVSSRCPQSVLCLLFSFLMPFLDGLIYIPGFSYHLHVSEGCLFIVVPVVCMHFPDASTWMIHGKLRFSITCSSCFFFVSIINPSIRPEKLDHCLSKPTSPAHSYFLCTQAFQTPSDYSGFRPGPSKQKSRMQKNSHYSQTTWVYIPVPSHHLMLWPKATYSLCLSSPHL